MNYVNNFSEERATNFKVIGQRRRVPNGDRLLSFIFLLCSN